jgi:hypothetical protein
MGDFLGGFAVWLMFIITAVGKFKSKTGKYFGIKMFNFVILWFYIYKWYKIWFYKNVTRVDGFGVFL